MAILERSDIVMLRQAVGNGWPIEDDRRRKAIQDLRETIAAAKPGSRLRSKAIEALGMFDTLAELHQDASHEIRATCQADESGNENGQHPPRRPR